MNSRAFNLFTALISFILIILSVLLVQSMIQSERNTSDIISNIETASKLRAVGELARADAIQVFNYNMRLRMEQWLTTQTFTPRFGKNWKETQENYATAAFGGGKGTQFAEFASNALIGLFSTTQSFGNYTVCIDTKPTTSENCGKNVGNDEISLLKKHLAELVNSSVQANDFFTVVGCDEGNPFDCKEGTFYVNLRVQDLDDETYEALPRIFVRDNATDDEIQLGILPRTNFKIFVPLRLFKAIATARAFAHYPVEDAANSKFDEMNFNSGQDYGLISPRIHNELQEMGLGLCDKSYCNARQNPYLAPVQKNASRACPGDSKSSISQELNDVPIECNTDLVERGICQSPNEALKYNPADPTGDFSEKNILEKIAKRRICWLSSQNHALSLPSEDGFQIIQSNEHKTSLPDNGAGCDKIDEIKMESSSMNSKKIAHDEAKTGETSRGQAFQYSANNPMESGNVCPFTQNMANGFNVERKLGYYEEGDEIKSPEIAESLLSCNDLDNSNDGFATCTQLKSLDVILQFEETNDDYKVNKNNKTVYRIDIADYGFVPFTAGYDSGGVDATNCALTGAPNKENCNFNSGEGWYCVSNNQANFCQAG